MGTVGVDENVIAASWQALEDAYTYGLLRAGHQPPSPRETRPPNRQPAWRPGHQPGNPCVMAGRYDLSRVCVTETAPQRA